MKTLLLTILLLTGINTGTAQADMEATLTFNTSHGWVRATRDAYEKDLEQKFETNIEILYKEWFLGTLRVKVFVDARPATAMKIAYLIQNFIDSGNAERSLEFYQKNKHKIAPFNEGDE